MFYRRASVQIEILDVDNDVALQNFVVRLVCFIKGLKCTQKRFDLDLRWLREDLPAGSLADLRVLTTRVVMPEFERFNVPRLITLLENGIEVQGGFVRLLQVDLWYYDNDGEW